MVYLLESSNKELESKFINILKLRLLIDNLPEIAETRRELGKERLKILREIMKAEKINDTPRLKELYIINAELGEKIDKIDNIIHEGYEISSKI